MDPKSKHCVNYIVLCETLGITLQVSKVKETLISTSRCLKLISKCLLFNSIVKSKRIILDSKVRFIVCSITIPSMHKIKSLKELRNLRIKEVLWYYFYWISFSLSNGEFGISGCYNEGCDKHIFDPAKKITKVEVIICKNE